MHEKNRGTSPNQALTIIEMLLVLALVVLLALLLIPLWEKTVESGKQAGCIANQKSITAALLLYACDNNNRLPNYGVLQGSAKDSWWYAIKSYLPYSGDDTRKLGGEYLRCPSAKKESQMTYGVNYGAYGYSPFSYQATGANSTIYPGSKRLSQLSKNTFLLADIVGVDTATAIYHPKVWPLTEDYNKDGLIDSASPFLPAAPYNHVAMRHNGHAVFSFADGSARLVGPQEWAESRTSPTPIWGGLDF